MITQVGLNGICAAKDPRRKAQSVQFRRRSNIPYKSETDKEYERQQNNALKKSLALVGGAALFTIGYFTLAGMRMVRA